MVADGRHHDQYDRGLIMVNRWVFAISALFMMFVVACKATEENETKKWHDNVEQAQAYQARFPTLKPVLEERVKEAQGKFDAAKSLSGDEKAAKMAEANQRLADLLAPFKQYEDTLHELDTLLKDKEILNQPGSVLFPLVEVVKLTKEKVAQLSVANAGEAKDRLAQATKALASTLERVKELKPKPAAAPATAAGSGSGSAAAKK